jgi:hypothetical protein
MSPERVTNIVHDEINMQVGIRGKPGEEVTMAFLVNNSIRKSTCRIGPSGTAKLDALYGCFPGASSPSYTPTSDLTTHSPHSASDLTTHSPHSAASGVHTDSVLLCVMTAVLSFVTV